MTAVIAFDHVFFGYHAGYQVLQDITWQVSAGDFVALVGPNGGGKTTLLKLIMGHHAPSSGTVRVFGREPEGCCGIIAYVPQSLRFDRQFPITSLEVVLMGRLSHLPWYGRYRADDRERALAALEQVGLPECMNMPFSELSGGQRQRILIARALASDPQLLLLDEPTASVDVQAEADIYRLLSGLQGKMTIVMVTHDLQAAIKMVGHVACVQRSLRLLAPHEVCQHYALGLYHS